MESPPSDATKIRLMEEERSRNQETRLTFLRRVVVFFLAQFRSVFGSKVKSEQEQETNSY